MIEFNMQSFTNVSTDVRNLLNTIIYLDIKKTKGIVENDSIKWVDLEWLFDDF
jgi:hypothetical protein